MSENKRLTPKQQKFLQCLLVESNTRAAAKCAGVSEATAYRWLDSEYIRATLAGLEATAVESRP